MSSLLTRLTEKTQLATIRIAKEKQEQERIKKIEQDNKLKQSLLHALEMIPKIEKNLLDCADRGSNSLVVTISKWSSCNTVNIYENAYRQELINYFTNQGLTVEMFSVTNSPNLPSFPHSTYDHNLKISW